MAIQVMIKRRVHQGRQAKELVPLLLRMRALAMFQPGYISSETWCDLEQPGDCIVISKWQTVDDWGTQRTRKPKNIARLPFLLFKPFNRGHGVV